MRRTWSPATSGVAAGGLSAVMLAPFLLRHAHVSWHRDWPYFQHHADVFVQALGAGSWLGFDPWHCAGFDVAANPQTAEAHPAFLLVWALGPGLGLRAFCWLHLAVGGAGFTWWLRRWGLGPAASVWAGVLWACAPPLAAHVSEGHVPFAGFAWLPLLLGALGDAVRRGWRPWGVVAGGLAAWLLLAGSLYVVAFAGIFAFAEGLWTTVKRLGLRAAGALEPLRALAVAGGLAAALAAPKLFPAAVALFEHPREPIWADGLDLPLAWRAWTSHAVGSFDVPGHPYDWPEYALTPGWFAVCLGLVGLAVALRHPLRRVVGWVGLGGVLSVGSALPWVDAVRRAFPAVGDLQVPSRFGFVVAAGLVVASAVALDGWGRRSRVGAVIAMFLGALALGEVVWLSAAWYGAAPTPRAMAQGPYAPPEAAGWLDGYDARIDLAPALRLSLFPCYEPMPHAAAPALLRQRRLDMVRVTSGHGRAGVAGFAPGRWSVVADSSVGEIELAQVCQPHWRALRGAASCGPDGLLRLYPDGGRVDLAYENPWRAVGVWTQVVSLAVLVGLGWSWRRERRRRE